MSSARRIPDDWEEPNLAASQPPSAIAWAAPLVIDKESRSNNTSVVTEKKKNDGNAAAPAAEKKESRPKRSTAGKRKNWIDDDHEDFIPPPVAKRQTHVAYVAEWQFPVGTTNIGQYVVAQLKQGIDATVVLQQKCPKKYGRFAREKGRKNPKVAASSKVDQAEELEKETVPFITDVEFDKRFLQYDRSPLGYLDQLVRPPIVEAEEDPSDSFLQKVPDEPIVSNSASRIGARYQARVAPYCEYRDKRGDGYLPE
jgi:hypothetical protein